jgi:hypothetical protein
MRETTREELYEIVWSSPMREAAKQFGISDVALAKTCRKAGIPIPPRGFWLRPDAQRHALRTTLPPRGIGQSELVGGGGRYRCYGYSYPDDLIDRDLPAAPSFPEPISAVFQRTEKLVGKVRVVPNLDVAHVAIQKILKDDEARREKLRKYGYRWDGPLFDSPFEQRRLRILNAILLACARVGAQAGIHGKEQLNISVKVGDTDVGFELDDPKQIGPNRRNEWRTRPDSIRPATDVLRLEISSWKECSDIKGVWEDQPKDRIEKHLFEIVTNIIVAGEVFYRAGEMSHHDWLVKRKAQLIEEARLEKLRAEEAEQRQKIREERERVSRLLKDARDCRKANAIREYVRLVIEQSADLPLEEIEAWSRWALQRAELIDPIRSRRFLANICNPLYAAEHSY